MGPEGVENSIFAGKDEVLSPQRPHGGRASSGYENWNPQHSSRRTDDIDADVLPLNEAMSNNVGTPANQPTKPVMKRSFPPVGVTLHIDEPMERMLASARRPADVEAEIAQSIADVFMSSPARFRIVQIIPSVPPATVAIQLNIVADRSDHDARSPMQLGAEIVTQSQIPGSELRQAPVLRGLRSGSIAEDPFPGHKDAWAGGVATLRSPQPNGTEAAKRKKSKGIVTIVEPAQGAHGSGVGYDGEEGFNPEPADGARSHNSSGRLLDETGKDQRAALTVEEQAASNTSQLPGGVMQCEDGGTYAGELLNGLRHGRGKQVFANGQMFTGCFQHDRRCGIGRLDLANDGGFYLGEWKVRVEGWVC